MGCDLPEHARADILKLAERHGVKDVILFGSRATGRNWERSDIDLAVRGGDTLRFSVAEDIPINRRHQFYILSLPYHSHSNIQPGHNTHGH